MDKILPSSDDPLFSIFIIIVLVLITAVVSYVMGNYKEERKEKSLKNFLGKMDTRIFSLDMDKIPFELSLVSPLTSLAGTLSDRGEYQRSIALYLYLIQHIKEFPKKEYLLESLGKTYLKAGFLQRAEMIFLEILHKHPRNSEALYYLEMVYELLGEYDKAIETLTPLKVLGIPSSKLQSHLELLKLLKNSELTKSEKFDKIVLFLKNSDYSYRQVIQELFKLDAKRTWAFIDDTKAYLILDILWFLPSSNLNLDIISKGSTLKSIYLAKGIFSMMDIENWDKKSNLFSIDVILLARKSGMSKMDLSFTYLCKGCKQSFPISFIRCPQCYAFDSIHLNEKIVEKKLQRGYSLL